MPPLSKKSDEPKLSASEEWISIRHSKVEQPEGVLYRRVPREAFDEVWSDLGWLAIPGTGSNDPAPVEVAEEASAANTRSASSAGGN